MIKKIIIDGIEYVRSDNNALETGKDYISINNEFIVLNRKGDSYNSGFCIPENGPTRYIENKILCTNPWGWREATRDEVKKAFKKALVARYGEDWETMDIKVSLYAGDASNCGGYGTVIYLDDKEGWKVWNKNGLIYCDGQWAERKADLVPCSLYVSKDNDMVVYVSSNKKPSYAFSKEHGLSCKIPDSLDDYSIKGYNVVFNTIITPFLINKYGEDWETMELENDINENVSINQGGYFTACDFQSSGLSIWNTNGRVLHKGTWAKRLIPTCEYNIDSIIIIIH